MKSLPLEFQSANISKFLYDWHLYMKEIEDLRFVAILEDLRFVAILEDLTFVAILEDLTFVAILEDLTFVAILEDLTFVAILYEIYEQIFVGNIGVGRGGPGGARPPK